MTPEKDQSPAKGVGEGREEGESGEKGEEEESEEDDDAIDWQPVAGRGRGRGKSQYVSFLLFVSICFKLTLHNAHLFYIAYSVARVI